MRSRLLQLLFACGADVDGLALQPGRAGKQAGGGIGFLELFQGPSLRSLSSDSPEQSLSLSPPVWGRHATMSEIDSHFAGGRASEASNFNPPSPWGEGRRITFSWFVSLLFQSTLPVGGGTGGLGLFGLLVFISIHPPRGGRDCYRATISPINQIFQSTLPVGGGTQRAASGRSPWTEFQSTLPVGEGP